MAIKNIKSWKLLRNGNELARVFRDVALTQAGAYFDHRLLSGSSNLSQTDVILYFLARFGEPAAAGFGREWLGRYFGLAHEWQRADGDQDAKDGALAQQEVEATIRWEWVVAGEGHCIVYGGMEFMSAVLVVSARSSPVTVEDVLSAVNLDRLNYRAEINVLCKRVQEWNSIVNPYWTLRRIVDRCRDELQELQLFLSGSATWTRDGQIEQLRKGTLDDTLSRLAQAYAMSSSLHRFVPLRIDAFFTTLFTFLVQNDDRPSGRPIAAEFDREDFAGKLQYLHSHFSLFQSRMDSNSEELRRLKDVYASRNRLFHPRISTRDATPFMLTRIPGLFAEFKGRDMAEEVPWRYFAPGRDFAKAIELTEFVRHLEEKVIGQLSSNVAKMLAPVLYSPLILLHSNTKELGGAFGTDYDDTFWFPPLSVG